MELVILRAYDRSSGRIRIMNRSGDESRFRSHAITVRTHPRRLSIMASSTLGRGRSVTAPGTIIARANDAEVFDGLLGVLEPHECIWVVKG